MEKNILLKVSGSEAEPQNVVIRPGVTAKEVLASAGLDTKLFLSANPAGEPLAGEELVWEQVEDGGKLWAGPRMTVGNN